MTSNDTPRFDPDALRDRAGDAVFARGEAYFRNGRVDILDNGPSEVVARVAGTEDYQTIVAGQGGSIGGGCSCPAYAREGFCKHMVAVALAANGDISSGEAGSGGRVAQIRDYLRTKDTDALVEMIMDMVDRHPALLQKLKIGAAAAGADDEALESQLRTIIREATRTRGYVDYEHAPRWAARVDAALIVRMGALQGAAEQAAYVAALKERHGRKRNLMNLLG